MRNPPELRHRQKVHVTLVGEVHGPDYPDRIAIQGFGEVSPYDTAVTDIKIIDPPPEVGEVVRDVSDLPSGSVVKCLYTGKIYEKKLNRWETTGNGERYLLFGHSKGYKILSLPEKTEKLVMALPEGSERR